MKCLQCNNEASKDKALCSVCFEAALGRKQAAVSGYKQELVAKKPVTSLDYAPYSYRFFAFLSDSVVWCTISSLFLVIFHFLLFEDYEIPSADSLMRREPSPLVASYMIKYAGIQSAAGLIAILICFVFPEASSWKASMGKKLLGLRLEAEGGVTQTHSFKRNILKFAPLLFPILIGQMLQAGCFGMQVMLPLLLVIGIGILILSIVAILNPIFIFFTEGRRSLADIFADTRVVIDRSTTALNVIASLLIIFIGLLLNLGLEMFIKAYWHK
jgi:uncharacterized RDD family membrane protein YckC